MSGPRIYRLVTPGGLSEDVGEVDLDEEGSAASEFDVDAGGVLHGQPGGAAGEGRGETDQGGGGESDEGDAERWEHQPG